MTNLNAIAEAYGAQRVDGVASKVTIAVRKGI
jgi:hypothetical protein